MCLLEGGANLIFSFKGALIRRGGGGAPLIRAFTVMVFELIFYVFLR